MTRNFTSVGAGAADGLEAGFGMGLQMDAAKLQKRASDRADDELALRQGRERRDDTRQGLHDNLDLLDRQNKMITGRQGEIERLSTAAQTAGQPVDPALAQEYGQNAETLTGLRQKAMDFFSRAQTGQLDPLASPPAELYTHLVAATGRSLPELRQVPQHVADVQAGLETGNDGLLVQGVNGILAPQLRRGVGEPSPYGGTITRKEIIGLDPAVDANHQPIPGKFMPRLRVYVDTGSSNQYYDAPMTQDGSGADGAKVAVIDVADAMQQMGNLGTLATAIQRPDVAAKLDQGEQEAGPKMKQYLDQLTAISRPAKTKGAVGERMDVIAQYAKSKGIPEEEAAQRLQGMGVLPMGVTAQKQAAIDNLDPEDPNYALKRDALLGAGGKTTGLVPQKPVKGAAGGSGNTGTSAALGGTAAPAGTGDAAVDFWAKAVIAGDREWQIGLGRSKSGSELIEKVKRRVPELAKEMGLTPQDMGSTRAQQAALGSTLKELTKRAEAVDMFASKVEKDMTTLDGLLDKAGSDSPLLINKPLNVLRRQFSDAGLAQLDLAAKQVGTEYERLIQGGALSVAQLHAGASEDAKKLLNGDMPPKQARAIMEIMRTEMRNAKSASHESRDRVVEQIRGLGGARVSAPTPAAGASKYQEGQTATGPGGKKMVFKGGSWQPM